MNGRRTPRRARVPVPPRGLRARLLPDQVRDLALCHLVNLDAIDRGAGCKESLRQWAGAVFTWQRVAAQLQQGSAEMLEQQRLLDAVYERFAATGRVRFEGAELALARAGVDVMDQLAERVDRPTAIAAAEWSERRLLAFMHWRAA